MVENIKLQTTEDAVKLSQYATKCQHRMWLMNGYNRQCIDAASVIGVMYAMAKFKSIQLCVFDDNFDFPKELEKLRSDVQ